MWAISLGGIRPVQLCNLIQSVQHDGVQQKENILISDLPEEVGVGPCRDGGDNLTSTLPEPSHALRQASVRTFPHFIYLQHYAIHQGQIYIPCTLTWPGCR
jgi:hypothetical protein